jgi:hypothetical protein
MLRKLNDLRREKLSGKLNKNFKTSLNKETTTLHRVQLTALAIKAKHAF